MNFEGNLNNEEEEAVQSNEEESVVENKEALSSGEGREAEAVLEERSQFLNNRLFSKALEVAGNPKNAKYFIAVLLLAISLLAHQAGISNCVAMITGGHEQGIVDGIDITNFGNASHPHKLGEDIGEYHSDGISDDNSSIEIDVKKITQHYEKNISENSLDWPNNNTKDKGTFELEDPNEIPKNNSNGGGNKFDVGKTDIKDQLDKVNSNIEDARSNFDKQMGKVDDNLGKARGNFEKKMEPIDTENVEVKANFEKKMDQSHSNIESSRVNFKKKMAGIADMFNKKQG